MSKVTPFLKQVAWKYYSESGMDGLCFIFPNRRSMVFFKKYLTEAVKSSAAGTPLLAPVMLTENDFFTQVSGMKTTDRITLLIELYDCYKALNPKAETLDEFVFWGDVLLGDFNDVDKYLVDPHQLYTNVSDLKAIRDDFSYLTDRQREAIEKFIGHFANQQNRTLPDGKVDVKQNFMQIWNILEPLYTSFNAVLRKKGYSYEGMAYRTVAESLMERKGGSAKAVKDVLGETFPGVKKFVFVGLNALNECEKTVMRKMQDAGIAAFCWDYSGDMIKDPRNKSSLFMTENVKEFPQEYEWEEVGERKPRVRVVSVPSSVGQVKVVPELLRGGGEDFAIVLPDESLLVPLLNSIPPEIKDVNVTMGRSMSSSVIYSLMSDISALQLHQRQIGGKMAFYHRQVRAIFSNGIFSEVADEECLKQVQKIKDNGKIYIPEDDFKGNDLLELIFRSVVKDVKSSSVEQIHALAAYLMEAVVRIAVAITRREDMEDDGAVAGESAARTSGEIPAPAERQAPMPRNRLGETDNMVVGFAKAWYCEVNRLDSKNLEVLPSTWLKLLDGMVAPTSVPFRGEPLKGLQIMGPLETRALDFSNLVILSSNEGIFPGRSVSSSFIPPELRRGFNLPTYEYQDAVWAYYFYRMISRAENVWMVYDSRTEGLHTGEESRFIKQLDLHFGLPLERSIANAGTGRQDVPAVIKKEQKHVDKIRNEVVMSATTIQNYLSCPAKFYYSKVEGLEGETQVTETVDAGVIGNVLHEVMRCLYIGGEAMAPDFPAGGICPNPLKKVTAEYLEGWKKRKDQIREKVKHLMAEEMKSAEISGRSLVAAEVIVNYVLKILERDIELLTGGKKGPVDSPQAKSFDIRGLELKLRTDFHGFKFFGIIDRLDSLEDGTLRVCDYKTGKVLESDKNIDAATPEKIFGPDSKERPKIALQIFIYDMLLRSNGELLPTENTLIYNTIYQTSELFTSPVENTLLDPGFYDGMVDGLEKLLDEMVDLNTPFSMTEERKVCEWCDFRMICGR